MARRRSFRRRVRGAFARGYARTRTIVQRVYSRPRRQTSFLKKNKMLLTVGLLAVVGFYFKDKIKAVFNK